MKSTGALSGQYTAASSRRLYEAIKAMGLFKKLVVDKETDVLDLKRAEQEWLRQADFVQAQLGNRLHATYKELMMDCLTLIGQEDLSIKAAREFGLLEHLTDKFKQVLKNAGKTL